MSGRKLAPWLVGGALAACAVAFAVFFHFQRPARSQPVEPTGFPLGPSTPFDPKVIAPTDARGAGVGTAFSIDNRGVWLTARHVVEGCSRIVIVTGPGRGVTARAVIDPGSESALLFTTGGAPGLAIAPPTELRRGTLAFHPGFPKGRPGEVASKLLRRETLILPRRGEPVLAWAEVGHSAFLWGSLAGLSGAPALDARGQVIAVTVAQAPRRRRLYTTTPSSLTNFLKREGRPGAIGTSSVFAASDYHLTADALRRSLSVAEVACLGD